MYIMTTMGLLTNNKRYLPTCVTARWPRHSPFSRDNMIDNGDMLTRILSSTTGQDAPNVDSFGGHRVQLDGDCPIVVYCGDGIRSCYCIQELV